MNLKDMIDLAKHIENLKKSVCQILNIKNEENKKI